MQIFSEELKAHIESDTFSGEPLEISLTARELYFALVLSKIGRETVSIAYPNHYYADDWIEKGIKKLKEVSPTAAKAIKEFDIRELYHL